jgi:two-component system NtrC family sensor kinase
MQSMSYPFLHSLVRRVQLGYGLMVTLVAVIMLLVALGLADIRRQVSVLESVSALTDTVLEIRRYEKNWLLYRQDQDFHENQMHTDNALALLKDRNAAGIPWSQERAELDKELLRYRQLMDGEFKYFQVVQEHADEEQIRGVGKGLVELSEVMNRNIRSGIDRKLARLKAAGLLCIVAAGGLALFLGKQMTKLIVQPLQHIVDYTQSIAAGHYACCEDANDPVEIRAVNKAICHMLEVLEKRERQLIQSEKMAAVGTLVAGVAHELNNPLSNASTSAQILLEELQEVNLQESEFLIEMAAQIDEETDRARNIIRSLLEFAHDREMRPKELALSAFVTDTCKLVKGDLPDTIDFRTEISHDGAFFADKRHLQQALINILRNAAQALDGAGEILLKAGIAPEEHQIVIEIRDNGPGISAMDVEKIFDPFYTTKDVGKGSGLGLAVTREIITKHGGEITVESEQGKGAAFFIRLPMKLAESKWRKNVERGKEQSWISRKY